MVLQDVKPYSALGVPAELVPTEARAHRTFLQVPGMVLQDVDPHSVRIPRPRPPALRSDDLVFSLDCRCALDRGKPRPGQRTGRDRPRPCSCPGVAATAGAARTPGLHKPP